MKWGTVLPKVTGRYIVTIKTSFGRQVRQADYVEYPKGNFYWSILPNGGSGDIVAWFKEPKPYNK